MSLVRVQQILDKKKIVFQQSQEDGLTSLDFLYRGLLYHIWEFPDEEGRPCGVETNLFHAGRSEDIEGNYEEILLQGLRDYFQ